MSSSNRSIFCGLALVAIPLAHADELPALRQGKWEISRTAEGMSQPMTVQKCTDPVANMKKGAEAKGSCTRSPTVRAGNTYRFSATCTIGGVQVISSSVMTIKSDSAYSVDVETKGGGKTSKEHISARRVGDC